MKASPALALLTVACALAACATNELDVGTDRGDSGNGGNGGGSLGACQATCSTPAGTVQPTTSLAQAYAQIEGMWLFCNGRAGAPADAIGLEFAPVSPQIASCSGPPGSCGEGEFYYLVQGPSGPARGSGFAYEMTYDISAHFQIHVHPAPNAAIVGTFRYSPCPKELELPGFGYATTTSPVLIATDGSGSVPDGGAVQPVSDSGGAGDGAACPPAGPEQSITTIGGAETAVDGSWRICTGLDHVRAFVGASDVVGMEFGPATDGGGNACPAGPPCSSGDLYFLVEGSSGLVRGQGFAYQGAYGIFLDSTNRVMVSVGNGANGGWGTAIRYSSSPRQLDLTSLGYNDGATMEAVQ